MDDRGTDLLSDTDEALLQHLGQRGAGRGFPRCGSDGSTRENRAWAR
jgi:hypothetical protein